MNEAKKIVFESTASDLPGTMLVPGHSIFEIGVDVSNAVLDPQIAQVTPPAIFGDCMWPSIDASGKRIPMVCTGDPLLNGTVGNRVFVLDRQQNTLYQITGAGDVQGSPQSNLGQWFVAFATTSDLTGAGVCGYQIYIVDFTTGKWAAATQLGQLPPDAARAEPALDDRASHVRVQGVDGSPRPRAGSPHSRATARRPARLVDDGRIGLNIGAPDEFTGEAPITVSKKRVQFPPTYIPGIGAVCIEPTGDGQGMIDCTGSAPGADITLTQDHNIDDTDFVCQSGCRETMSCVGMLNGPHQSDCPRCDQGTATCNSGPLLGHVCDPGQQLPELRHLQRRPLSDHLHRGRVRRRRSLHRSRRRLPGRLRLHERQGSRPATAGRSPRTAACTSPAALRVTIPVARVGLARSRGRTTSSARAIRASSTRT